MDSHKKELRQFILNIIFALCNCLLGMVMYSWWFVAAGAYYVVLSVMRVAVLAYSVKNRKNERFVMKLCGVMIFFLAVVLCGIVYMTIKYDKAIRYHEIIMIAIALYAFIKISVAITGTIKSRKSSRICEKTLKSITLVDSVVSIYSLQRSMLVSFDGMTVENIALFNTLSGIGMCIIVVCIGINLIKGANKMAKSKIVKGIGKISDGVTAGYKKVEDTVVGGYKAIEKGVVGGYTKIEDKFVDLYLTRDGETVEEAKERLKKR